MMMRASGISRLTALLLAGTPLPVLAQPTTGATQPFPQPAMPAPAPVGAPAAPQPTATAQVQSQIQAATEQRISGMQSQLAITPAQMPQWNAFAQVMRENAQTTDTLFRQRAASAQGMNAAANMVSYAQISRAYADGTEKLAAAFQGFYGVLSDQQKLAADTLFRQQSGQSAATQPIKR
jgi:protein CpxP